MELNSSWIGCGNFPNTYARQTTDWIWEENLKENPGDLEVGVWGGEAVSPSLDLILIARGQPARAECSTLI